MSSNNDLSPMEPQSTATDTSNQIEEGELVEMPNEPQPESNVNLDQQAPDPQTDQQPEPSIHNFAAVVSSSTPTAGNFTYPAANARSSPNFSFDSDSPGGLAIAEEDETPTDTSTKPEPDQSTPKPDADPQNSIGSVDSTASAERDGFEVVHVNELNQQSEDRNLAETNETSTPVDQPSTVQEIDKVAQEQEETKSSVTANNTWADSSPGALQIDEDDAGNAEQMDINVESTSEEPKVLEDNQDQKNPEENQTQTQVQLPEGNQEQLSSQLQGQIPVQLPGQPPIQFPVQLPVQQSIASTISSIGSVQETMAVVSSTYANALNQPLLPQQGPSEEVLKLMNEQTARELREKLELEQKRQVVAFSATSGSNAIQIPNVENSKISISALYSLGGGDPVDQLPRVAAALLTPTQPNAETSSAQPAEPQQPKRREAYRWASNLPIFAMAWSYKRYPNQRLRLACSSIRDGHELLKNTMSIVEFDEEHGELTERTQVFIGAPSCELKFIPTTDASQPDLIASATRELRIYSYHTEQQEIVLEAKLCPNKSYAYAGPLTSVDWNEMDPRIVGGSSIDSTCTIWDVEAQESIAVVPPPPFTTEQQRLKYKIQTQLIAHERPVHDMAFSRLGSGREYFGSCGADGSVRLFDLRNLKNSTILYEHPDKNKLNHISWNKVEPTQFVIVADSSNELVICDVRMPCRPLIKYSKHTKPVNSVDWAPHSATHFCSGSSDHEALIWQLQGNSEEPLLAYRSEGEITRIRWSSTYNNWIGISFTNFLEILRV